MYLQWEYDDKAQQVLHQRDWEMAEPSPVMLDEGEDFELEQLTALQSDDRRFVGLEGVAVEDTSIFDVRWADDPDEFESELRSAVAELTERAPEDHEEIIVHQPLFEGEIGAYTIRGMADFLLLRRGPEGVEATIFEVKSSSEQKVHHRYQATIYAMLLEDAAEDNEKTEFASIDSKIVTPNNSVENGLEAVNGFDTTPYRTKLELKLAPGGSFDQTIIGTPHEQTTNRIAQRCSMCEYEEVCTTQAVENQGLELLGLQAGTQKQLAELGIETVEDFATLYDQPGDDASHRNYAALDPIDDELVRQVRQQADISNLQKRSQIAYRFLSELDNDHGRDGPDFFPNQLQGTGYNLPKDNHDTIEADWEEPSGVDYPTESLIRVYLYVQQDFARNRITLLSAVVENTRTGNSQHITELPEELPTDDRRKDVEEDRLIGSFFERLISEIQEVAPSWEREYEDADLSLDKDDGFVHLYMYSDGQRDALMEAVRRHPGADWRRPLRTLLGLRAGVDQEMVSIIQDDFRKRWALRFPGLGLLQATAQFKPFDGDWFEWHATRGDGSTAKLNEIFAPDLFDSGVRHNTPDGTPTLDHSSRELLWTPDDQRLARWVYPTRNREASQLPIAYIWSAYDKLTDKETTESNRLEEFRFRTADNSERITVEDIRLVSQKFAEATRHIELGLWNKSKFVDKEPIDLAQLAEFNFEQRTIDEACIEYQQLEYHTHKTSLESYYSQPIEERIDAGSSIAFECTAVDEDRGIIEGQLLVSDLSAYDAESDTGVIGSPLSVSDGDFMLMTKLTDDGDRPEDVYQNNPTYLRHSPTVIVNEVDESTGGVQIEAPFKNGWPTGNEAYTVWHKGWGTDEDAESDNFSVNVSVGDQFVIDPALDQITQARAREALDNAVDAPVRRWLRQIYQGERDEIPVSGWDEGHVDAYLDRIDQSESYERPNPEQESFITDTDHGIVTLQGPPGTGKTQYTVAPAVLGRLSAAAKSEEDLFGIVSAVSHSAVDEALDAILDLQEECPVSQGDLELYRICSTEGRGHPHPDVTNIYYSGSSAEEQLTELYERQFSDDGGDERAIYFAPPVSIRSCFNKMLRVVDDADADSIEELYTSGEASVFDLVVVDEASMMDLPLCFLVSSFLDENGQLLLVGDHRQMQPIQRHEWEDEDREPIEANVPFLSALDFLRYLRDEDGADIEYLASEPPSLSDPDRTLPVHRLRETYRLPAESAKMHTELFYRQDGIELKSAGEEKSLPDIPGPVGELLDTDDRVTLLIHDGTQSQKSNPIEQALITELLAPLEDVTEDISAGVVVPFRAQRRDVKNELPPNVQVDTVERFQGGERDVMVLSMTASDRGYINQVSEFLLDPRRFNVGASRMKRKVIIIASVGLFEESSNDIEQFERQKSWVSFYDALGGLDDAGEELSLEELVSAETWEQFIAGAEDVDGATIRKLSGFPQD